MLTAAACRYIELRRSLGFKLHRVDKHLAAFAQYAQDNGDTHIRTQTAVAWVRSVSERQRSRLDRMQEVRIFARFLQAEDPEHEVPPSHLFYQPRSRPAPYIYTPDEVRRLIEAARGLSSLRAHPIRGPLCATLIGLLASTGLRVSEALNLRLGDLLPGGVLRIRDSKFGKSRLVPLHPSVVEALDAYLHARLKMADIDDHVFLSADGRRKLPWASIWKSFQTCLLRAGIENRAHHPRMHDLRHTFATRVLEQCATNREDVGRNFVALHTYLGHGHIHSTYWYLEATPHLMGEMAAAAEALIARRSA